MMKKLNSYLKRISLFLLILIIFGLTSNSTFATETEMANKSSQSNEEAIIVLSTVTLPEMQSARKLIEKQGGVIKNIFPPSVFIATIPLDIIDYLKDLDAIKEVAYEKVDPNLFSNYDASTLDIIELWNRNLEEKAKPEKKELTPLQEEQMKKPFSDKVIIPTDLPKTKKEKQKKDQEYRKHWQLKKQEWLRQTKSKGFSTSSMPLEFGKTLGAGYYDTSLYMAGDIAVGVFFAPGTSGDWTTSEISDVFSLITTGLNQFINDEPNARVNFTYVKEVDNLSNPNPLPNNERDYINDLRNIYSTHWAYMIVVYKGVGRAYAYLFGPSTVLYSDDLREGYVVRHETMHIFGAMDQYHPDAGQSPIERWGYLNVVNANSQYNNGKGYFSGRGEGLADIMISSWGIINPISVYSRGQIGWRDSDGDGILEPLDTFPDTVILNKTGSNSLTYTGQASDKALINEFDRYYDFGDVTLNTITSVEYRINQGAWISASAQDGAFDSGQEGFIFTTPVLKNGRYTLEVRATNSVGNTEVFYARDKFTITQNNVANVRPFAGFIINPPEGSIQTDFTFDASSSSDIEDDSSLLEVRWDFENDGVWDTAFSQNKITSFNYTSAGLKNIRLEVRDTAGLTHSLTKSVEVADYNRAPKAFLTMTPENRHGKINPFTVRLDAAGSFDGEDAFPDLQVRWDFEDDGIWDTDYSNNSSVDYGYLLTRGPFLSASLDTPGTAYDVSVLGTYAYIADGSSGLQIIDVSNPANPTWVGNCATHYAFGVYALSFVYGSNVYKYAYIADDGLGIQIIDVSNPSAPWPVRRIPFETYDEAKNIFISGKFAYVAEGSSGLEVLNLPNPWDIRRGYRYDTPGYAESVFGVGNYAYVADGYAGLEIFSVNSLGFPALVGSYNTTGYAYDVFVSGNYAYVADGGSGLQIIDVSNPANPTWVGYYGATVGTAIGVFVYGNCAYVGAGAWLQIIDVSNPYAPKAVGSYMGPAGGLVISQSYAYLAGGSRGLGIVNLSPTSTPSLMGSYDTPAEALSVDISGNYAYVADGTSGLQAINISSPYTPKAMGSYDTPDYAHGVFVSGNYAYIADWSSGLQIVDITNPDNLTLAGNYNTAGYAQNVFIAGNYAYVADGTPGLEIIDISNPSAPQAVGNYNTPGYAQDVLILANYAYVADGSSGLQIINVSNPQAPSLVGSYNTAGDANSIDVFGNYAYIADGNSGLQIIDISNPTNPTWVGNMDTDYAMDVFVSGNFAYVADRSSGIKIIDITNPANPILRGNLDTDYACGIHVTGDYYAYVADEYGGLKIIDISTFETLPVSKHWRARLEIEDTNNQTSQTTRDIWAVTYNYPPLLGDLERSISLPFRVSAPNSSDPDSDKAWDSLMEYRWDFQNDRVWDTDFSTSNFINIPHPMESIACEVKDRFNATDRKEYIFPGAKTKEQDFHLSQE